MLYSLKAVGRKDLWYLLNRIMKAVYGRFFNFIFIEKMHPLLPVVCQILYGVCVHRRFLLKKGTRYCRLFARFSTVSAFIVGLYYFSNFPFERL